MTQSEAASGHALPLRLYLHARHPDACPTFAPARLARDAQLQRLRHLVRSERVRPELARDGKAQRVRTPARDVALIARDAIARAHDTAGKHAARAVVVAHLDRALETVAGAGIGGPVEMRAHLLRPIVGGVAEEGAIVEFRRAHDLPGIVKARRVEPILDLCEGGDEGR